MRTKTTTWFFLAMVFVTFAFVANAQINSPENPVVTNTFTITPHGVLAGNGVKKDARNTEVSALIADGQTLNKEQAESIRNSQGFPTFTAEEVQRDLSECLERKVAAFYAWQAATPDWKYFLSAAELEFIYNNDIPGLIKLNYSQAKNRK